MATKNLPMRLAMRVEGRNWNAYIAKPDTMDGAIWIASIAMKFVENNKQRRDAFLALMQSAVGEALEEIVGTKPTWNEPMEAPEHERTKE